MAVPPYALLVPGNPPLSSSAEGLGNFIQFYYYDVCVRDVKGNFTTRPLLDLSSILVKGSSIKGRVKRKNTSPCKKKLFIFS